MMKPLNTAPRFCIGTDDSAILVLRFTFETDVSTIDFSMTVQSILYDSIGASGFFRIAPAKRKDLNPDYIQFVGHYAKLNDYFERESNEVIAAFYIEETDEDVSITDELNAFRAELDGLMSFIRVNIQQVDIDTLYEKRDTQAATLPREPQNIKLTPSELATLSVALRSMQTALGDETLDWLINNDHRVITNELSLMQLEAKLRNIAGEPQAV